MPFDGTIKGTRDFGIFTEAQDKNWKQQEKQKHATEICPKCGKSYKLVDSNMCKFCSARRQGIVKQAKRCAERVARGEKLKMRLRYIPGEEEEEDDDL